MTEFQFVKTSSESRVLIFSKHIKFRYKVSGAVRIYTERISRHDIMYDDKSIAFKFVLYLGYYKFKFSQNLVKFNMLFNQN